MLFNQDPQESLKWYLKLLAFEHRYGNKEPAEILQTLDKLAEKLALTKEQLKKFIDEQTAV